MSVIPPHYSERYINLRYNKALYIVQHLPASSTFQPTKAQKLELYAYYKQVSHGDVDTQRPGIFDVVGRAKWDAWKKLEGMKPVEAKHRYIDILLRAATEAYKKPWSRTQAQEIIQMFASLKLTDDKDTDVEDDSGNELVDENDEDSSIASAEAEEQAYLQAIRQQQQQQQQQDTTVGPTPSPSRSTSSAQYYDAVRQQNPSVTMRPSASRLSMNRTKQLNRRSWHGRQVPPLRAPSVASTHSATMSMATARTSMPRRLSVSSSRATPTVESVSGMRPQSSASMRSQGQERRPLPLQAMLREPLLDESLDNTINPWVHHPSIQRYHLDDGHTSDDSIEDERLADRQAILDSRFLASPSPHPTSQQPPPVNSIPRHDIPTISSQDTSIRSGRATPSSHSLAAIAEISGPMSTPKPSDESIESIGKIPALSLSEPHSQMGSALPPSEGSQPKRVSKPLPPDQYTSVVALGPATKRALESLQMEIFALNERIDGLRQELMERDQRRRNKRAKKRLTGNQSGSSNGNDDDSQYDSAFEGWKWVIKAAVRHAFVNLATAICLFLLLYRQGNPIAYVLVGQARKYWQSIKFYALMGKSVA